MRGNCVVELMMECGEYSEVENNARNNQSTDEVKICKEKEKRDLAKSWGSRTFSSREGKSEVSGHCWPEDREMLFTSPVTGTTYCL